MPPFGRWCGWARRSDVYVGVGLWCRRLVDDDDGVANHHFGKFADVWKHLLLVEVLAVCRPARYAETHAGSAAYPVVADPERDFGFGHFLRQASEISALADSLYHTHLAALAGRTASPVYPGSALLAMLELQQNCEYLFCDLDPDSVSDLAERRDTLEIVRCTVARTNGLSAVAAWVGHEGSDTIVHIDPFDPELVGGDGRSALDLAEHLIERGTGLVYWYGYDNPSQAAWAYKRLARGGTSVWCVDAMITDLNGSDSGGDWVCGRVP
jgi:23S rRNA A2030 N6-methylase RlmJ